MMTSILEEIEGDLIESPPEQHEEACDCDICSGNIDIILVVPPRTEVVFGHGENMRDGIILGVLIFEDNVRYDVATWDTPSGEPETYKLSDLDFKIVGPAPPPRAIGFHRETRNAH